MSIVLLAARHADSPIAMMVVMIVIFGGVTALVVLLLGLAWWFNPDARVRRALRAAPLRDIGSLRPGEEARVTGRIVAIGTLRGPLSGRDCVYYKATVDEHRHSGKHSRWIQIIHEEQSVDFAVVDATGEVRVEMQGAKIAVMKDSGGRSGTFDNASAEEEAFLARHGRQSTGLLGMTNRPLRYAEGALEVGEEITVYGRVAIDGDTRRLVAPANGNVYVSDDPRVLG